MASSTTPFLFSSSLLLAQRSPSLTFSFSLRFSSEESNRIVGTDRKTRTAHCRRRDLMKRDSSGAAADPGHPSLCFHREILIVQKWTQIRQDFLSCLTQSDNGIVWKEPRKLWRYSQEALGKWILSQTARAGPQVDMRAHHFFPSAELVASFPGGQTYDEQLIRDLTLKSNGADTPDVAGRIQRLVRSFGLARRCAAAQAAVAEQLAAVTPRGAYAPRLRRMEEDAPDRNGFQRRVRGPLAVFGVEPVRGARGPRLPPPAYIPWAAYEKLRRSYKALYEARDRAAYPQLAAEELFLRRAAVVAWRYEGCLATGSLQLCADTSLKQSLHASGYLVLDLCASPINAYMGVPCAGTFASSRHREQSSLDVEEQPNYFCSAFYDTDVYFGSLGSVLQLRPLELLRSKEVNPAGRSLLLTYDVPYDEDLCEQMFTKLIRDMAEAERARREAPAGAPSIDYVLVLPLWWNIQLPIAKQLFQDGTAAPATAGLAALLEKNASVTDEGYRVPYAWPTQLPSACQPPGAPAEANWACFDGVFVGSGYRYFSTQTNQWVEDVTSTEVIGLAEPTGDGTHRLQTALRTFYGVQVD
ncbi:hypothetical protein STCU_06168 [Strigomonas culicis]|uniref:PCIF1 WW domain-containing protein n=1 Tax=Strigomonas culicis TaxID=28005 RepID=S9VHQ9_9TRYP|nr:hypothetical protein STCU_06168 [Strigomonas culicis]|eukprot:EPY26611.1 hypothetical protein STCU_06168 [Strigomonas culicis]